MSLDLIDKLKTDLTDKYVVVMENVPELRRFVGLTGIVKTVNMSGRALVQFDGPVDIGWYDIDPKFLKLVEAPVPKKATAEHAAKGKPAAESASVASAPDAKKAPAKKGLSPLEMARQQGAAQSGGAPAAASAPAAAKSAPATEGKKLSPLELARQQGAATSGHAPAGSPAAPAAKPAHASEGKKLSPLELARQQGAAKSGNASADAPKPAGKSNATPEDAGRAEPAAKKPPQVPSTPVPTTGPDGKKLSPLELARLQGPFKG